MRMKHRLLRWLGIVSPSGAYPLPPRWAMSRTGRERWYPEQRDAKLAYAADIVAGRAAKQTVIVVGDRSTASGGSIGYASTGGSWAADVVVGPVPRGALTRFSTGDPVHEHGVTSRGLCGPNGSAECYDRQPYVSMRERAAQGRDEDGAAC